MPLLTLAALVAYHLLEVLSRGLFRIHWHCRLRLRLPIFS